ncbi:hypothetical protein GAMM_60073 [Gammaproteobacteria bacterium]
MYLRRQSMSHENIKEQFGALGLKGMLQYFDDMIDHRSSRL